MAKKQKVKTPLLYKMLGPAMAIPAGIVVKKVADTTWEKVRGYPPPKNPAAPGVSWPDALAWAARGREALDVLPEGEIRGLLAELADFVVARVA